MSVNNVTVFKGRVGIGTIPVTANGAPITTGTLFTSVLNMSTGAISTSFAPAAPANNQILQTDTADLSADTFLLVF